MDGLRNAEILKGKVVKLECLAVFGTDFEMMK